MKRIILLSAVILAAAFNFSCVFEGWESGIVGDGNVTEEIRDVSGFSGVHISSGIDVYISQEKDFKVLVVADENLLEIIETDVKGDVLVVGVEHPGIRRAESKKVYVSLPELDRLKISSAGDCIGETPFSCNELKIDVSSAGDLKLEVVASSIDLDISSSGDVRLKGKTGYLDASLSSAGDLDAFDLEAGVVHVNVSSAGDARVFATEELKMNASSAGNIYYRGDAKVLRAHSSSAGDIVNKN